VKLRLALAATIACALTFSVAERADAQCSYVPVQGSAGEAVTQQALQGFSRLYGATGAAEREVLPTLRLGKPDDFVFLAHMRWTSVFGAARYLLVPEQAGNSDCAPLMRSDYDLHAGTFGMAFRKGPVSVFYLTSTIVGTQGGLGRVAMPMFAWIPPGYYWFAAPFIGPWEYENRGLSISGDFIAGAQVGVLDTNLALGYIGTKGLYTNLSQEKIRLFATAALAREFRELAYLKGGLDRLKTIQEGLTSVYARKVVFSPPPIPTADGFELPDVDGTPLWTAHLEHANIAKLVSVKSALAVSPGVFLHDLRASVHTDEFYSDPVHTETSHREDGAAAFTLGTVRIPENQAVGQAGKQLLSVQGELRYFGEGEGVGDLGFQLAFNDPEILTRFPSASNVFSLSLGGTFSPR
jgi:hypothetical protein